MQPCFASAIVGMSSRPRARPSKGGSSPCSPIAKPSRARQLRSRDCGRIRQAHRQARPAGAPNHRRDNDTFSNGESATPWPSPTVLIQAAGERRGEGDPELDRGSAPSHPHTLCDMSALAPRCILHSAHAIWISGAATGDRQCVSAFAVKCPHRVSRDASLDGDRGARQLEEVMSCCKLSVDGLAMEART
jgi:hypothetical protein